ncbi:MAG TPA: metallophosphoesterase [Blastocatellia bacterium]|nr:metallophosphoesterase [Blastocatellia bacterium]
MKFRNKVIVGLTALAVIGLALWAFVIEPNRLVVTETSIAIPELPPEFEGMRIAALSDLHVGFGAMTMDKLRDVVSRTNALHPDVVVLLGDYVSQLRSDRHAARVDPEVFGQPLAELHAAHGVYAVLGNHDWWYNAPRIRRALERAGIRVLENDAVRIERGDGAVWIAGVGDHWSRHHDVRKTEGRITDHSPVIAITHTPDVFAELPPRFNLLLAGHTHGGQVNLPILGVLSVPSKDGTHHVIGHYRENGHDLFITPGIGMSILPVRFRVPPEISVLTLTREGMDSTLGRNQPPPTK